MIRDLLDKKGEVNLLPRPRRFGKTLNMSMLQSFFEDARDDEGKKKDKRALFNGLDISRTGENEINDILLTTISYLDANESYYHGFVSGLLTGVPGYIIKSNREGGTGRSDLVLLPLTMDKEAFLFEFKKTGDIDALGEKADEALVQIEDRKYREEVRSMGY